MNRLEESEKKKGFHATYDYTTRVDLSVLETRTDYKFEILTDLDSGHSVRAPMIEVSPSQFQLT